MLSIVYINADAFDRVVVDATIIITLNMRLPLNVVIRINMRYRHFRFIISPIGILLCACTCIIGSNGNCVNPY